MAQKKYAVLSCEDHQKWGGVDNVGKKIIDVFREDESEDWEYFRAVNCEFPDVDRLSEYGGFVISGSHYSANDVYPWITKLMDFIRTLHDYGKDKEAPKMVGICFGHQIMNRAMGAKVVKNECGRRFIFGLGEIQVVDSLQKERFYRDTFGERKSFVLLQSHSEEVTNLPNNAMVLGHSGLCPNEIVAYGKNLLSFQGHMEITDDDGQNVILPTIKNNGVYSEDEEEEMRQSYRDKRNQREEVIQMINRYMKL